MSVEERAQLKKPERAEAEGTVLAGTTAPTRTACSAAPPPAAAPGQGDPSPAPGNAAPMGCTCLHPLSPSCRLTGLTRAETDGSREGTRRRGWGGGARLRDNTASYQVRELFIILQNPRHW